MLEEKIQGLPTPIYVKGQSGLLDIVLHPDYANNGWIYLSYSKQLADSGGTVIARAKLEGNNLTNVEELFSAQPLTSSEVHFGSRIVFDGKGYMFFTSGERGKKENAQDLGNHLGKVLRLHDDGKVPTDNPFVNTPGAKPEIWSYGHRNLQGLYYDKATGILWEHEHGPRGGDELNIVEKGKNYGWPVITYGINYDSTIITDLKEKEGMEQPVRYWVPSIAPCGLTMVTSDKYPNWKGNLLVGALAHQLIARVEVADKKFVTEERLIEKIGRVRAVVESPDGYIYVATENPGKLLRLVPVDSRVARPCDPTVGTRCVASPQYYSPITSSRYIHVTKNIMMKIIPLQSRMAILFQKNDSSSSVLDLVNFRNMSASRNH